MHSALGEFGGRDGSICGTRHQTHRTRLIPSCLGRVAADAFAATRGWPAQVE